MADFSTYIGIDVQAVQKPYFYTALNGNLETIACGHGRLGDVLAYLAGQSTALVAINAPVSAQIPEDSLYQEGLFSPEQIKQTVVARTGDSELTARGFQFFQPVGNVKKLPLWVERSLELTAGMKQLGYDNTGERNKRSFFETQSDAGYWLATGTMPYESRSLEGRLQRQLLLYEFGFPLKDPMVFLEEFTRYRLRTSQVPMEQILPAHELRAIFSAATAWLVDMRPDAVECVGQPGQGEIIIPKEFSKK
ncbi:hypothetical protein [Leptolinea tardivitalis]|nr:hypothetical protein [Leptolinea tardivitalis]GAP20005.1 hypothetical protein LTAR_00189 [Leptolinea tardivitalis]